MLYVQLDPFDTILSEIADAMTVKDIENLEKECATALEHYYRESDWHGRAQNLSLTLKDWEGARFFSAENTKPLRDAFIAIGAPHLAAMVPESGKYKTPAW
jgi:hypothetical protein